LAGGKEVRLHEKKIERKENIRQDRS
jgi:hypothetical protein